MSKLRKKKVKRKNDKNSLFLKKIKKTLMLVYD